MNKLFLTSIFSTLGLLLFNINSSLARPENGIVAVKSSYSVQETVNRFETIFKQRGLTLFNHIDHAANAASVGQTLRPTHLLIFGNPQVGTTLMQCSQGAALDLPMKALIWKDDAGQVWLGYNDPEYLQTRHGLNGCEQTLANVEKALNSLAKSVTQS
ncbi:MAG: DUF302 domain-containing protein [Xenococcaceae cyanobacterium]